MIFNAFAFRKLSLCLKLVGDVFCIVKIFTIRYLLFRKISSIAQMWYRDFVWLNTEIKATLSQYVITPDLILPHRAWDPEVRNRIVEYRYFARGFLRLQSNFYQWKRNDGDRTRQVSPDSHVSIDSSDNERVQILL